MLYCRNCGKEISDEASYCLYCGARQKENFCRNCGKEIPSNAAFCPHCGSRQKDDNLFSSLLHHLASIFSYREDESVQGGYSKSTPDKEQDNISQAEPVQHTNEEIQNVYNNDDVDIAQEVQHDATSITTLKDEDKENVNSNKEMSSTGLGWVEQAVDVGEISSETDDKDTISTQQEMSEKVVYEYHEMPLFRRFVGSVIDKILIILSFVLVNIAIDPYKSVGDLGIYRAMLGSVPANYEYIDRANINGSNGISNLYGSTPYVGQTMDFDIKMTTMIVVVYLLYFFVFEIVLCGSPGKRRLGGYLLNKDNEKIVQGVILLRAAIRGALSIAAIYGIHFLLGLTYYHVIIVLLLLVDIPLFICHRSLIDLGSGTYYLEKGDPIVTTDGSLNYVIENSINAENDIIFLEEEIKEEEEVFADEQKNYFSRKYLLLTVVIATIGFVITLWYFLKEEGDLKKCPELVEAAKSINSKVPILLTDGMEIVNATYVDTAFTLFFQVDGDIIPFDKIDEFQKEHKRAILASIQVSKGKDRKNYEKFVEYHITKVDKFINKETGDVVTIITLPKEIEVALNESLSDIARLEQYIDTQKKILPTEIDKGFVMKDMEIVDDRAVISISVDENTYDFRMVGKLKDELKDDMVNQLRTNPVLQKFCQMLSAVNYGLTYRYYGNQSFLETFIHLSPDDISNLAQN